MKKGGILRIFAPVCLESFPDEKRYRMPDFLCLQGKETPFFLPKMLHKNNGPNPVMKDFPKTKNFEGKNAILRMSIHSNPI